MIRLYVGWIDLNSKIITVGVGSSPDTVARETKQALDQVMTEDGIDPERIEQAKSGKNEHYRWGLDVAKWFEPSVKHQDRVPSEIILLAEGH